MTTVEAITVAPAATEEVKAYLRIETAAEDALIARLIAAAIGHGEDFIGRMLLARGVDEIIAADGAWRRLGRTPVTAIASVAIQPIVGAPVGLAVDTYAIDIDAAGDGWVRIAAPGDATRATIHYTAGMAADWAGLPEPLRQGVVRLASHLYTHRDAADEGAPPAAVAALWRAWRRMRLA